LECASLSLRLEKGRLTLEKDHLGVVHNIGRETVKQESRDSDCRAA
jgi:hypothetical protein